MRSTILLPIFLLIIFSAQSQDLQTWSELNGAKSSGESAKREASTALSDLERSHTYSTLKEIRDYASDAESDISSAQSSAGWAASDASDAVYQAHHIGCSGAENNANKAKSLFESAKSKLGSAKDILDRMGSSEHREHEAALLNDALSQLKDAVQLLDEALDEIDAALRELNDCD